MNLLEGYSEHLFQMLLENVKVSELPFILSERLRKLLNEINHPIATELLKLDTERSDSKMTFIDFDTKEFSPNDEDDVIFKRFTFVNSNKVYDNILKYYDGKRLNSLDYETVKNTLKEKTPSDGDMNLDYWKKSRTPIKVGAFITKIFDKKFVNAGDEGNDVTSFVNMVYGYRAKGESNDFELVSGEDIKYWYLGTHYEEEVGSLGGSCMRYDRCQSYLEFYAKNEDVSLLILHGSDRTKITGRAIVWKLATPDRTFMDRIYTTNENAVELFKNYASKNEWLYKFKQNMDEDEFIMDGKTDENLGKILLVTRETVTENDEYPYCDTMKYYSPEIETVSNQKDYIDSKTDDEYFRLDGTQGDDYEKYNGYDDDDDHYGETYVDFYDDWIDNDNLQWCELGGEYRTDDDAIETFEGSDIYATQDYIDDNMHWSEYHDAYVEIYKSSYVDYNEDYILDSDIVDVFLDADFDTFEECKEKAPTESRGQENSDTFEYVVGINTYYFGEEECSNYFVTAKLNDTNYNIIKHIVWDKDSIFKDGNNVYFFDDKRALDKKTGQLRMFDSKNHRKYKNI